MKITLHIALTTLLCLYINLASAITKGQIIVNDGQHGPHTITYEVIGNYAITEGDIIIDRVATLNAKHASVVTGINGTLWPQGLLPFEISEDLPISNKLAVLQAIVLWQKKTNLRFVELTSKNRSEYPDYISFVPGYDRTCASFVGKQKGAQIIILSPRCDTMNTVHEIGHASGLWHEQSREDRDNYVRILWENIEEEHRFNFEQHLTDGRDVKEYDYDSIMHYGPNAFSKNGFKTIVPLVENVEIGQRSHLSEMDIAAINSMYPFGEG